MDFGTADRSNALAAQTASTAVLDGIGARLRMTVSHFFQVYQLAIARGVFSPSGRASYELSVNEETVPALATEADLLLWADRIIKGEARRLDPPSLRRRAREWGVFYALRPGEPAEPETPQPTA